MVTFYAEVKNAINKFTGEAFSSSKQLKKKNPGNGKGQKRILWAC